MSTENLFSRDENVFMSHLLREEMKIDFIYLWNIEDRRENSMARRLK